MASTYVDNYTLLDTVNAQDPSSTQYTEKQKTGTLDGDSYAATSATVHTIPTGLISLPDSALADDGVNSKALYETFLKLQVNWDNAMRSLDDSGGVAKTDYEALAAIGNLDDTYSSAFSTSTAGLALLRGQDARINIFPRGSSTRAIATMCQAIATQFAACTANLDADGTLNDTDYASTLDIDFTAKTGWVPPLTTSTAFQIYGLTDSREPNAASRIKTTGIEQEALVDFLNTAITNYNALWVKLDADI